MSEENPTYQCRYLTGQKLQIFRAIADRIIPAEEGLPGGGSMATAGVVDWAMHKMEPKLRDKFLLFLNVVQFTGFFFGGRSFTKLSPRKQDKVLSWLENNKVRLFRLGFFGAMTFVKMGHYTREDQWKSIHFSGPIYPDKAYPDMQIRLISQGKMKVQA